MKMCLTCKRVLNNPDDLLSQDCGGDCLRCMADAGDLDCIEAISALAQLSNCIEEIKAMETGNDKT